MSSILTVLYVLLVMGGVAYVVYRVVLYMQNERDREARLNESALVDDQFRKYLEDMKKQDSAGSPPADRTPKIS
jgi:hypothetical protein